MFVDGMKISRSGFRHGTFANAFCQKMTKAAWIRSFANSRCRRAPRCSDLATTSSIIKSSKRRRKILEEITLVHAVFPREERDATKVTAENKPFASVYIEPDQKVVLSESGFDEFPYMAPRFTKASSELGYGRSPSMTALPDIKMLNKMSEVTIRAAQKQVDPPLLVPDDGFMLPVRTIPDGLNFYRSGTRDRIEPLNIGANNPLGLNMEEQRRQAIRAAYYVTSSFSAPGRK